MHRVGLAGAPTPGRLNKLGRHTMVKTAVGAGATPRRAGRREGACCVHGMSGRVQHMER
eukprot:CAMPEP_0176264070 /NCGR_PEP_ID=MMETSP0121_2-20121125/41442_1 /TAXON_ID=160619 /ORGANISM="Kryptoperidinium foliaceum, Strain CCMP 1326" /LENGTH=58 /DNA_ID=CAMNT_0017604067 /DNA_START=264 /DNA_END=436 /DNA_ORIENTATION=+